MARVAYQLSEVIAIYPITPSSPMGEWADQWAAEGKPNLWGRCPSVIEMQSEGGRGRGRPRRPAGGRAGDDLHRLAGPAADDPQHVQDRRRADPDGHSRGRPDRWRRTRLSIFGDHSDVMAARATGFALLASNSVQEAMDFALIAHAATLESRVPFLHFFDGFRTSHEVSEDRAARRRTTIRAMIDEDLVAAHRAPGPVAGPSRAPRHRPEPGRLLPGPRGRQPLLPRLPGIVQNAMDRFAALTGRRTTCSTTSAHPTPSA